ncbi:MAG TPA: carboxypeptidase regulatory-like domain-containing protein [Thermoanaerobaculia bacterium]|nr:carboxypeptidase regulatory-like domain-containing protein [Thermoanaerobaculia bacterium]
MHRLLWSFLALCCVAVQSFAALTGVVMTSDGTPISGARVSLRAHEPAEAMRTRMLSASPEVVPIASTQTDSKGTFSFESPKEAVVELLVFARGYEPQHRSVERDEEAGAIMLSKAEMKKGSVTAGGKPVAGANVAVYYGAHEYLTKTDEHGRYEAPDPKRVRLIVVTHPDFAPHEENFFPMNATPASALQRTISAGSAFTGRVVSATNDAPVAKATILVDGWPLGVSGEDGTFSIAHMPAKWKNIVARKDNLIGQRAVSKETTATIRVAKGATVTGRITDSKSRVPLAGALVRIGSRRMAFGSSESSTSVMTDAKGTYSAVVTPGAYGVTASHPGYEFGNTDAAAVAGQQTSKDLALSPRARVSGVVVDEMKRPVAAAVVNADNVDSARMGVPMRMFRGGGGEAVSGPDGRFSTRVTPDEDLWLRGVKRGMPPAKSDPFRLAAGERKTGVVLTIPTGIAVSGRVTDANDAPLSGVSVTSAEAETSGRMVFRNVIGGPLRSDEDTVVTASDGTFTVRVKEGTHDFTFRREGFAPKVVRGQSVSATSSPLIETKLDPAVEITGRVTRAGTGIENARVSIFGPGAEGNATTGPDGSFTIGGLAPGTVRLMVRKEEEFVQEMRSITAPARDVKIELPAGGRVSGRVVEKGSGKPITTFHAGISTSRGGPGMMMLAPPTLKEFTSEDGSFVLEGIPGGAVVLVATSPGFAASRLNITVEDGKSVEDVELQLDAGVKLAGRVTGSNGAPLSDVRVHLLPSPTAGFSTRGMENSTSTDSNGEYSMEGLEAGEETVMFTHAKHTEARKSVTLKGRETKLDVQLTAGLRVTGTVVTDSGAPVADAEVDAYSGSSGSSARTNATGTFEIESLKPGRYTFRATKSGYAEGNLEDVDITAGAPIRITMRTGGTIYGRVIGLSPQELADATVDAWTPNGSARSAVDAQGNYRIEGVGSGTVQVVASTGMGMSGSSRRSPMQSVDLAAGGSQQLDITFRGDIVISGRVIRNGVPMPGASVMFSARGTSARASGQSPTDDQGRYSVSGLEEGEYNVMVGDRMAPHQVTYHVRGTATFDIDYKTTALRGRVFDAATNEPVSSVAVQLRSANPGDGFRSGRGGVTDASGTFILDSVSAGSYTLTATKEGFGTEVRDVVVGDSAPQDMELRLARNEGVTLTVVDARDGRTIAARATGYDMQGRVVAEPRMMFGGGETGDVTLALPPGSFTASVAATGYATRNIRLQSPSKMRVELSRGGTLLVRSKHSSRVRVRLIDANGIPYPRFSNFPAHRELLPSPGTTTFQNIAAGTYTMQLLGDNEVVLDSKQIVIAEEQTLTEEI